MTMHRDFNVDKPQKLEKILKDVNRLSKEIKVVLPIHPRTKKRIQEFGFENLVSDIMIIEPIDYLKLMGLTENCYKVVTDSGGYQKEAYFAGKQACIIMPDTSWRELVDCGLNVLTKEDKIYDSVMNNKKVDYIDNIYGNGKASEKIISILRGNY
jgi:UDP-GlcNAc3NAcA epimerase